MKLRGVHEVEIEFDVHIAATVVEQHIISTTSLLLITRFKWRQYSGVCWQPPGLRPPRLLNFSSGISIVEPNDLEHFFITMANQPKLG